MRTFSWFSRVHQSKIEANKSRGSTSYDRTNKQIGRQTEITTLYILEIKGASPPPSF